MERILQIIDGLRRLCLQHRVRPENIKITVEFLNPVDKAQAECAMKMNVGPMIDFNLIQRICDGKDFNIMGFKFAVKEVGYMERCMCPMCQSRRDGGMYKINPHAL